MPAWNYFLYILDGTVGQHDHGLHELNLVEDLAFFYALDTAYAWYHTLGRRAGHSEILGRAACRVVIDWMWTRVEVNAIVSGAFDMGTYSAAALHPIPFLSWEQRVALDGSSFRPVYLNGGRSLTPFIEEVN